MIREERSGDIPAVRKVNERAFGRPEEADIVDKLRASCGGLLSLVATHKGHLVGHVLFSPATIVGHGGVFQGMGLAPLAVLPEYQGLGFGSSLVRSGLDMLRQRSCPFVIVLGHPEYYPRFGFERASRYGLSSQWKDVPDNAFMILILDQPAMCGASGVARYRDEFDQAI